MTGSFFFFSVLTNFPEDYRLFKKVSKSSVEAARRTYLQYQVRWKLCTIISTFVLIHFIMQLIFSTIWPAEFLLFPGSRCELQHLIRSRHLATSGLSKEASLLQTWKNLFWHPRTTGKDSQDYYSQTEPRRKRQALPGQGKKLRPILRHDDRFCHIGKQSYISDA